MRMPHVPHQQLRPRLRGAAATLSFQINISSAVDRKHQ
ncbi:hypothetical protein PSPO01_16599 [Paraphaeosphaeria sporulosa]